MNNDFNPDEERPELQAYDFSALPPIFGDQSAPAAPPAPVEPGAADKIQALDDVATPPPEPSIHDYLPANFDAPARPSEAPMVTAPDAPKAPPPAPLAPTAPAHDDGDRLAALNSILGDGSGEETAIREAAGRDRQRADQRQMSEYLSAALRRQPSQQVAQGPSDLDTEKLIQQARDKRQALLAKGLDDKGTGKNDPALETMRLAEAEHWRNLSSTQQAAEERKRLEDVDRDKRLGGLDAEKKAQAEDAANNKLRGVDLNDQKFALEREKFEWAKAHPKAGKGAGGAGGPALVLKEGELDKVPEGLRDEVAAVLKNNAPLRKPSKTDPSAAQINHWVYQLKPDFDPSGYERRVKTQEDFTTGKVSQGVNALNTAIAHLDELEKSIPDNSNSQLWNKVKNEWLEKSGNPVNRPFDVAKTAVSSELAKAYSSGVATEGEVKGFMDQLDRDSSPPQLHATAAAFKRFLAGKVAATQHQYQMGAGDRPIPGGLLSPEAEKSLASGGEKKPVKYLVSPDKARRVPVYADGTKGPEEKL